MDAWFTSPKFCQAVKDLGLQIIGRLKRDHTLYYRNGVGYTLKQLYQAHKHLLIKVEATWASLSSGCRSPAATASKAPSS